MRDKDNEAKIAPLRKAFGEHFAQLELVNADLLNADSISAAIAGSTYVVHVASPFYFPENDDDVIKPAVDGTMAVMHACKASGVKRCVITSSIAAIFAPAKEDAPDAETGCYDESVWSNPDRPEGIPGYFKSKTLAEKAAWDFQKSLPEAERFEIVCINPVYVHGPTLIPGGFTSADIIVAFFEGSNKLIGPTGMPTVDVRDISKMHLEGLRRPEAANQRFIGCHETIYPKEILDVLSEHFGPQGFTIPTKEDGEHIKSARVSTKRGSARTRRSR